MLDQINRGRTWATGALEPPLGRGINFEVQVENLDTVLQRIMSAGWPIFVEPEEKWLPETHSVVFTSATIAVGDDFSHFEHAVGLDRGSFEHKSLHFKHL